jgi:hypothetical protein
MLSVVIFCHSSFDVANSLIFTAQDMNMTNGDYAFFTWGAVPFPWITEPWLMFTNVTAEKMNYRKQAMYAVKQVRADLALLKCQAYL